MKCRGKTYKLVSQQKHGLQAELAVAEVEEIFEGWSQEVENHGVVVALGAEPPHERYTDASCECLVHL